MQIFATTIALALAITAVAANSDDRRSGSNFIRATKAHTQCYAVAGFAAKQEITSTSNMAPAFQNGAKATFKGADLRKKLSQCPNASKTVLNSSDDMTFEIGSGDGVCGAYDSDTEVGACLFSGTDQTGADPTSGGWVSGSQPINCGRKIRAWMDGQNPIDMPVVDGCTFTPTNAKASCSDVAFTVAAFLAMAGSDQTTAVNNGHLTNVHWEWIDKVL